MNAMGTETIFKTLSDIDRYELRTTRVQQSVGGLGAIGLRLYKGSIAVLVVLAIILLSAIWYWPNITWLRVVFIINYLLVPTVSMILPLIKLARNWKPIRYYVRNPFEVLLINAKLTAEADLHHLPDLMKEALSDLEFVLLQIKAERDFFERRCSIMSGAVEKVGIVPGLLVSLYNFPKDWNMWVWGVAGSNIFVYILAVSGQYLMMRLDRKIKLLELVIARNSSHKVV